MPKAKATARQSPDLDETAQFLRLDLLSCAARRGTEKPPEELRQSITIHPTKRGKNQVRLIIALSIGSPDDSEQVFRVEAEFGLLFGFPSLDGVTEEAIRRFGQTVGVLVVWAYWRELVQSMTARMGLPPLRMPLVRPRNIRFGRRSANSLLRKPSKKHRA